MLQHLGDIIVFPYAVRAERHESPSYACLVQELYLAHLKFVHTEGSESKSSRVNIRPTTTSPVYDSCKGATPLFADPIWSTPRWFPVLICISTRSCGSGTTVVVYSLI